MADQDLRELERRWRQTGAIEDEARLMAQIIHVGLPGTGGLTSDLIYAFIHRLIVAGMEGAHLERLFARKDFNWEHRLAQSIIDLGFEVDNPLGLTPDGRTIRHNPFGPPPVVQDHAAEEVLSLRGYPDGFAPRCWQEQVAIWLACYPRLNASSVAQLAARPLPAGAEGWLVMPKPSVLQPPTADDPAPYMPACRALLRRLVSERTVIHRGDDRLYDCHIDDPPENTAWMTVLDALTPGDFLVLASQFGLRHAGQSANRALWMMEHVPATERELPMGLYEVLAMLITHPERLTTERAADGTSTHLCEINTALMYYGLDPHFTISVECSAEGIEISGQGVRGYFDVCCCIPSWFLPADEPPFEPTGEPYTGGS